MEKNYQKRKIPVNAPIHTYVDMDFICGDIDEVVNKLINFKKDHKEYIKNLPNPDPKWLLIDKYEIDVTYYNDLDITFNFFRMETDEELTKRIETDKLRSEKAKLVALKRKEQQEIKERELFEKLKKKYE